MTITKRLYKFILARYRAQLIKAIYWHLNDRGRGVRVDISDLDYNDCIDRVEADGTYIVYMDAEYTKPACPDDPIYEVKYMDTRHLEAVLKELKYLKDKEKY